MASIKKNFAYNLVLTLSGYIFPLITFPYVTRVIGVQNIGICSFADSVINYFVLLSMLGIASYGIREIARVRQEPEKLNHVFSNLFTINVLTTTIAIAVLIVCSFTVPKLIEYRPFLLVGIGKLLFGLFQIEWLYTGLQEFRYITIRSLVVRFIYVILVFLFVHGEEDTFIYFFLTVPTGFINALINWLHSRRFVKFTLKGLNLKVFIIPILSFGYYRILTSMYTTFNTVFLGFSTNDVEVGYFTTATKLYYIILSVFSALTSVMIPKVSELLHEGKIDKLQWMSDQTLSMVWSCSIPLIMFSEFCADEIIWLLSGSGYEGAVMPFRVVIILLLVIGTEQVVIQQFLMASTKNKPILTVCTVGAFVGVFFNVLLTVRLGAVGSAVAWGVSELSVLLVGVYFVKKNVGISISFGDFLRNLMWSWLYVIPLFIIQLLQLDGILNLTFSLVMTLLIFMVINLFLCKNEQIINMLKTSMMPVKWLIEKR